jgi:hypothetical protein
MKTATNCQDFVGVRVRIQRLSDAKMCHGWVESFELDKIKIDVEDGIGLAYDERCFVEVSGIHSALSFTARFMLIEDQILSFQIEGGLVERESHEQVRVRVSYEGILQYLDETIPILIEDFSCSGVGFYCPSEIARWAMVQISVKTPFGQLFTKAQVRYCRHIGSRELPYRVGLYVQENESLSEITERLLNAPVRCRS